MALCMTAWRLQGHPCPGAHGSGLSASIGRGNLLYGLARFAAIDTEGLLDVDLEPAAPKREWGTAALADLLEDLVLRSSIVPIDAVLLSFEAVEDEPNNDKADGGAIEFSSVEELVRRLSM